MLDANEATMPHLTAPYDGVHLSGSGSIGTGSSVQVSLRGIRLAV